MSLYTNVVNYAIGAHGAQVRKYTNLLYVTHPLEVASILAAHGASEEQIAAGVLHDVVEDTHATLWGIKKCFGEKIAFLVDGMTDKTVPEDGNRAKRKAMDRDRLAETSPEVKTIKLADIISNTQDIVSHDPGFAKVYLKEIDSLLDVLVEGNSELYRIARDQIDAAIQDEQFKMKLTAKTMN